MKRFDCFRLTLLAVLLVSLWSPSLFAQGETEKRLTPGDSSSLATLNNARSVAAGGSRVHVVYYGKRGGDWGVFYMRSPDGGKTWGEEAAIRKGTTQVRFPSVAESETGVQVVWEERRGKVLDIYTRRSTDGGVTWGPEAKLTQDTMDSVCPAVAVSQETVHVAWQDYRRDLLMPGISYRRSTDGGKTWGPVTSLCRDAVFSNHPSIAASGSEVHMAWEWAARRVGSFQAGYRRSTDGGETWEPTLFLSPDTIESGSPSIAASGPTVCAVWEEKKGKTFELGFRRSLDRGRTWEPETVLVRRLNSEPDPTIATSGTKVCIAWADRRSGKREVYAKLSGDGGRSWGPEARLSPKAPDAHLPSGAIAGNQVHVVWSEKRDGNWEIVYRRNPKGKP